MKKNAFLLMGFMFASSLAFAAKPATSSGKVNETEPKKELVKKVEAKKRRDCFLVSCGVKCSTSYGTMTNQQYLDQWQWFEDRC